MCMRHDVSSSTAQMRQIVCGPGYREHFYISFNLQGLSFPGTILHKRILAYHGRCFVLSESGGDRMAT